jgi:hypothetical protein
MNSFIGARYEKFTKLVESIMQEVETSGGVTLDGKSLEIKTYKNGYQVSVKDMHTIPFGGLTGEELIRTYLYPMVADNPMNYDIGMWLYSGDLYIDYSVNIKDLEEALSIGRTYNQKTLYDWKNDDYVTVR